MKIVFITLAVKHSLLTQISVVLRSVTLNAETEDKGSSPAMTMLIFIFYFFLTSEGFEFAPNIIQYAKKDKEIKIGAPKRKMRGEGGEDCLNVNQGKITYHSSI